MTIRRQNDIKKINLGYNIDREISHTMKSGGVIYKKKLLSKSILIFDWKNEKLIFFINTTSQEGKKFN